MGAYPLRELHLFAGAGGGILAGQLLGHQCVGAVEIDPYCQQVLIQRQRDGILPAFPIWDDVRTFDGNPWRGFVEIVTGGFPCQPHSVAGKRQGGSDKRSLWYEMARIIGEIRPKFVFCENVPGIFSSPSDLCICGRSYRWGGDYWLGHKHKKGEEIFQPGSAGYLGNKREAIFGVHEKAFRRHTEVVKANEGQMVIDMDMAYWWARSGQLPCDSWSIFETERRTGDNLPEISMGKGHGYWYSQQWQCDMDRSHDCKMRPIKDKNDVPKSSRYTTFPPRMFCKNCGRTMDDSTTRSSGKFIDTVYCDLAEMGYDARWCVLGADDVGAPHIRKRLWILAYTNSQRQLQSQRRVEEFRGWPSNKSQDIPNANFTRLAQREGQPGDDGTQQSSTKRGGGRNPKSDVGVLADGMAVDVDGPWSNEPSDVPRVAQSIPKRVAQIQALGNGQVPLCAALAWRILSDGLEI